MNDRKPITYMTRQELQDALATMPDIEVGTDEGFVIGVEESTYDDETRSNVPYIHLDLSED